MRAGELAAKALDIAKSCKTLYVMGCFGAPLTGSNVARYCANHSYNRRAERTAMIRSAGNQSPPVFGFDCVGLIKGILWGWCGNPAKTYGGAGYTANGVPDLGANQMIQVCSGVSADFKGIVPGAAVWMQDHIGIYAGDGLAVECSPKWANGVQTTAVGNLGTKAGYNTRTWTKWGRLPYVTYEEERLLTEAELRSIVREELARLLAEMDAAAPAEPWEQDWLALAVAKGVSDGSRPMGLCTRLEAMIMACKSGK